MMGNTSDNKLSDKDSNINSISNIEMNPIDSTYFTNYFPYCSNTDKKDINYNELLSSINSLSSPLMEFLSSLDNLPKVNNNVFLVQLLDLEKKVVEKKTEHSDLVNTYTSKLQSYYHMDPIPPPTNNSNILNNQPNNNTSKNKNTNVTVPPNSNSNILPTNQPNNNNSKNKNSKSKSKKQKSKSHNNTYVNNEAENIISESLTEEQKLELKNLYEKISKLNSEIIDLYSTKYNTIIDHYDDSDKYIYNLDKCLKQYEDSIRHVNNWDIDITTDNIEENDFNTINNYNSKPCIKIWNYNTSNNSNSKDADVAEYYRKKTKTKSKFNSSSHSSNNKKRKRISRLSLGLGIGLGQANNTGDDVPVDPNEPVYCSCRSVSCGEMIACDNNDCPYEWFHYNCVGLTTKPPEDEKWYCPTCRETLNINNKNTDDANNNTNN